MDTFTIWTPHIFNSNPHVIEVMLMNAEIITYMGTDIDFAHQILQDVGVEAQAIEWTVTPYRSHYYADHTKSWQERWPLIWKARATLSSPVKDIPRDDLAVWSVTEAMFHDSQRRPAPDEPIRCLVVSDFDSADTCIQAVEQITADPIIRQFQMKYEVASPTYTHFPILSNVEQLQIDLGMFPASFYISEADYAMYILDVFKQLNGTTNYNDRSI